MTLTGQLPAPLADWPALTHIDSVVLTDVLCHARSHRSLADQDTDRYVLEVLSTPLRREMETLASQGVQWTDIVSVSPLPQRPRLFPGRRNIASCSLARVGRSDDLYLAR